MSGYVASQAKAPLRPAKESGEGKNALGRPTKLTDAVREKILQAIRMGCYANVAAAAAGVGETTYYTWLERGERESTGIYREFREAVKEAEAIAEARCVEMVQLAAPDNWQAAMTLMERRWPERWRRRDAVDVRLGKMTNEQLAAYITEEIVADPGDPAAFDGILALPTAGQAASDCPAEGAGSPSESDEL